MRRDKVLTRAIVISVVLHVAAIAFIGRSSDTRLSAAAMMPVERHLLDVALVKDPLSDPPKPKPVVVQPIRPNVPAPASQGQPQRGPIAAVAPRLPGQPQPPRTIRMTNNAGGALNAGTNDAHGDISGMGTGRTSVGVVPSTSNGQGSGSGTRPGVGPVEPPRPPQPAYVPPAPRPAPEPPPTPHPAPPPPPTPVAHKDPEPVHVSRLADRANPLLAHDIQPRVPDSVDEGQSLETVVEYYVDADGGVSDVHVTKSSGNRDWDRAVTRAASEWRYSPAVQDGVARRVRVSRAVRCKT